MLRQTAVGLYGVVVIVKRFKAIHLGTYFWLKFLTNFLNVMASLLMISIINKPVLDLALQMGYLSVDAYFCVVVYSFW